MKYVVFLDIDGVLNSRGYFLTDTGYIRYHQTRGEVKKDLKRFLRMNLDPSSVRKLKFILSSIKWDKEVWISSSWGRIFTLEQITAAIRDRGLDDLSSFIKGITPRKFSSARCNEISWALEEIAENYDGEIRWISIDDNKVFSLSYINECVFAKNKNFKVDYDPEFNTNPNNGLTYLDAVDILKRLDPSFRMNMDPI